MLLIDEMPKDERAVRKAIGIANGEKIARKIFDRNHPKETT